MSRPVVSRTVCLSFSHPSGAYGQIFIRARQFEGCWWEYGPVVYNAADPPRSSRSAVSAAAHDNILSQNRDSPNLESHVATFVFLPVVLPSMWFPFRRLLRLARLRWRYSNRLHTAFSDRTAWRNHSYSAVQLLRSCLFGWPSDHYSAATYNGRF
jgi:hypothetical protein